MFHSKLQTLLPEFFSWIMGKLTHTNETAPIKPARSHTRSWKDKCLFRCTELMRASVPGHLPSLSLTDRLHPAPALPWKREVNIKTWLFRKSSKCAGHNGAVRDAAAGRRGSPGLVGNLLPRRMWRRCVLIAFTLSHILVPCNGPSVIPRQIKIHLTSRTHICFSLSGRDVIHNVSTINKAHCCCLSGISCNLLTSYTLLFHFWILCVPSAYTPVFLAVWYLPHGLFWSCVYGF